jgi:putative ABC transport system permease protein
MNLVHLIVRQWRQRPGRTLLSIASVAIAVAAVLGVTLSQAAVRLGYRKLLEVTEGRPALEIVAAAGGRFAVQRVPKLADISGIRTACPIVTRATMVRSHGKRFHAVLLGLPPDAEGAWESLPLIRGRICRQPDEAVVSASLAGSLRIRLGDRLTVLANRGPRSATVVGLVDAESLGEFSPAATLLIPLAAAQQWFDLDDHVDRIRILLGSRDEREQVQVAVAARLPPDFVVQAPVEQIELAGGILRSTELALEFSGALSMAMAVFIVLNTLRMNFGERRRDMAVLRVLGVTSGQLVGLHLAEGVLLGLAGALAGIPLGLTLGHGLTQVMGRLAGSSVSDPAIPYWTMAAALVVGPLVACGAALVPALQSRGVSAAEALGDMDVRRGERFPLGAAAAGVVLWSVASVLILLVALERLPSALAIPSGVLMLVGFIAVIPALVGPAVRTFARPLAPLTRIEGEFAAQQLLERPTRTGLTVGVLVVAISTSLGLGNAILTNVNDVRAWFRRSVSGEILLIDSSASEEAPRQVNGPQQVRQAIARQAGVVDVTEQRFFASRVNGVPAACMVREVAHAAELPWLVATAEEAGLRARFEAGGMVVGSALAKRLALRVGQSVRVELQGRVLALEVAGFARDYQFAGLVVWLDLAAAAKRIDIGPPRVYMVRATPMADVESLSRSLDAVARESGLHVQSFAQLRQQVDALINGIVGALWGLMAVGFVVGGIAVANTLSMSVLEQTRELGLLRTIGLTRSQVRKLIFCQSLLLGLLGTLMGLLAGLTTAWIIHVCNEPLLGQSIPFELHGCLLITVAACSLTITSLAAWLPGERAARLDLLSAIACE